MKKGKEYDKDGKLIFEGEYLNGQKWNDNCKEYYDNGQFIGNYINGKRNGEGKEYNSNGELIFEGIYLVGVRWNGKGKEYNNKNELIFEKVYYKGNSHKKI